MHAVSENTLFHIKRAVQMIERTKGRDAEALWLSELIRLTSFNGDVIACSFCKRVDRPVALTEGGSSPEYSCPMCYAEQLILSNTVEEQEK